MRKPSLLPRLTHHFARSSEKADRLCDSSCFNQPLFYQQDKFSPLWHHSLFLEPNTQGSCISVLAVPSWNPHAIASWLHRCRGGLCRQQLPVKPLKILLWFFTGNWKSCCRKSPFSSGSFYFPLSLPMFYASLRKLQLRRRNAEEISTRLRLEAPHGIAQIVVLKIWDFSAVKYTSG